MRLRWRVEHTGKPYAGLIPEEAWKALRVFKDYKRAAQFITARQQRLPEGAWDNHYRIVPTKDTRYFRELSCLGWLNREGGYVYCTQAAYTIHDIHWAAGTAAPLTSMIVPAGWHSPVQCQECYNREVKESHGTR